MKYSLMVILSWVLGSLSLSGQQIISIDDVVAKVYEQTEMPEVESFKLPWVEEVNVRSETRDWKWREQSYSLRLSPVSLGERKASSKLYDSWQQELVYLKMNKVYDQVAEIHEEWIEQDFLTREIRLNQNIAALLQDVEKVTTKQSLIDVDELTSLLKVRGEIAKTHSDIALAQKRKDYKLKSIAKYVLGDYIVESDSIDLDMYIQMAKEVLVADNRPYVSDADLLELEILSNEIELEKAENNRVLDFVALEYRGPHDDALSERVSLGMSFNLPFFNKSKLSIAKLKVEQEKEQLKIEETKEESLAEIVDIKKTLFSDISEYDSYKQLFADIKNDNLLLISKMEQQTIINPNIILNHRIDVLENDLYILNLQRDIVKNYLIYLQATDKYILGAFSLSGAE